MGKGVEIRMDNVARQADTIDLTTQTRQQNGYGTSHAYPDGFGRVLLRTLTHMASSGSVPD